jgi:hypothetical protein
VYSGYRYKIAAVVLNENAMTSASTSPTVPRRLPRMRAFREP